MFLKIKIKLPDVLRLLLIHGYVFQEQLYLFIQFISIHGFLKYVPMNKQ